MILQEPIEQDVSLGNDSDYVPTSIATSSSWRDNIPALNGPLVGSPVYPTYVNVGLLSDVDSTPRPVAVPVSVSSPVTLGNDGPKTPVVYFGPTPVQIPIAQTDNSTSAWAASNGTLTGRTSPTMTNDDPVTIDDILLDSSNPAPVVTGTAQTLSDIVSQAQAQQGDSTAAAVVSAAMPHANHIFIFAILALLVWLFLEKKHG